MKNPIKIPITPFKTPKTLQKLPKPLKSPEKDNFLDRNSHFNDINQILTLRNELHTSMDNFNDFQKEIEKRYKRSVMNKIYTFPRQPPDFSDTSSCDSLKSIEIYDLSTQNYEKINISPHPLKDLSNSPNQLLFDREIAKLNKELAYYKNHQNRGLSQEKELIKPLEQLKMKENIPCEENRKGRLPNYMKLLNFLEENNDFEIKKSILEHRTPSNSRSCNRSRAMQKTPCSFDRKIAVTFENCCDIKEKPLEESGFRSVSKGKGGREGSRSQSKSKRGGLDGRVLSPISYTYMNNYLYDKEFKQESIKKIYSNSMLRTKETSKERKNHFQENDKKDRKESKSNKPVRKLYLIQGKENLNNKKTKPDPQKKSKPLKK